jgi:hypothetical protein
MLSITNDIKNSIIEDFENGTNKTQLSKKYKTSSKTILKIIRDSKIDQSHHKESYNEDDEEAKEVRSPNKLILLPDIDIRKVRTQKREEITRPEPVTKINDKMYADIKKRFLNR